MSEVEPHVRVSSAYNGYVFTIGNRRFHLPIEVTEQILLCMPNTLDSRQILTNVCQNWRYIIKHYVWIKIKQRFGNELARLEYEDFSSCEAYDTKNLIKNPSGENDDLSHWKVENVQKHLLTSYWEIIKNPKVYIPESFETGLIASCFRPCHPCYKVQTIHLLEEGILPIVMDKLQPKIYISEWFGSPSGVRCNYNLCVILADSIRHVVRVYDYRDRDREGGNWYKVEYTFQNYGPGVRSVNFAHGGYEKSVRRGISACWMTKATVKVLFDFSGLNGIVDDGPRIIYEGNAQRTRISISIAS